MWTINDSFHNPEFSWGRDYFFKNISTRLHLSMLSTLHYPKAFFIKKIS